MEERKSVAMTLLTNGCFPEGMELWPAKDEGQSQIIRRTIDKSDLYLVIIGDHFGSIMPESNNEIISYTQWEFRYAKQKKKRIKVFINRGNREIDEDKRKGLDRFKAEAENSELFVSYWNNVDDLCTAVSNAINDFRMERPKGGWIKVDRKRSALSGIGLLLLGMLTIFGVGMLVAPLPTPEIQPRNGQLTADNPLVEIVRQGWFGTIYYTTNDRGDIDTPYTGGFELKENAMIYAQTRFLFRRSEIASQGMNSLKALNETKESLGESETISEPTTHHSSYVSEEYMSDLNGPRPEGMDYGHGDNSENGVRQTYTIKEINDGAIDGFIIMNSILDDPLTKTSELYFTQVREADTDNYWNANCLEVEIGKEYDVRIMIHNNNPLGLSMVAKDVQIFLGVPEESGRTIAVEATMGCSNAKPTMYWDGVAMTCKERFHLEVVPDSSRIWGNGKTNGRVVNFVNNWAMIGFDELNGELPGCYYYSQIATVRFRVVAD